ncbi:hypothetical protein AK88_05581 [Plasmodium fragile]|uniref:Uncharacterized protein n=1 Tax=Plasmodium fragile TaxID=5857 RepID=A0A0D9QCT4_PLAFR|nr:uncharacterized protein AK88_05581 [Plasmodium fragile]KJP84789.1 hypothetical protein AK88_05581 [Plasmodium fragile]
MAITIALKPSVTSFSFFPLELIGNEDTKIIEDPSQGGSVAQPAQDQVTASDAKPDTTSTTTTKAKGLDEDGGTPRIPGAVPDNSTPVGARVSPPVGTGTQVPNESGSTGTQGGVVTNIVAEQPDTRDPTPKEWTNDDWTFDDTAWSFISTRSFAPRTSVVHTLDPAAGQAPVSGADPGTGGTTGGASGGAGNRGRDSTTQGSGGGQSSGPGSTGHQNPGSSGIGSTNPGAPATRVTIKDEWDTELDKIPLWGIGSSRLPILSIKKTKCCPKSNI